MLTVSAFFTLSHLWFMHDAVSNKLINMDHRGAAVDVTQKLEEGILFCEGSDVEDAYLDFDLHDVFLLIGVVDATAKDVSGNPVGRTVMRALIKTRQKIEDPPFEAIDDGDTTYAQARNGNESAS